jgi:two-component sensor histidine kinase
MVNELLTNAFKHAFPDAQPGTIDVDLFRTEDNRIRVSIADDGVGMSEELMEGAQRSLGLQLVDVLATQVNAEVRTHAGSGTHFLIEFPDTESND